MFVEEKKVMRVGNSICITINPNASPNLTLGDKVKIEYHKDEIVIRRTK